MGSIAAAAEGGAGGSQGRVVQEGLLGSLPVLDSPDSACAGHKGMDCSPQAAGNTCKETRTKKTQVRVTYQHETFQRVGKLASLRGDRRPAAAAV